MPDPTPQRPPVSAQARDQVIQMLTRHFANDVIELGEFERRVDAVHRARSSDELRAVIADLPRVATATSVQGAPAPAPTSSGRNPAAPTRRWIPAIMAGASRKGAWVPGERTVAVAVMGGIELDFREVELRPGTVTEVVAVAVMGGVEIVAPPGVTLDVAGGAFMGGFDPLDQSPMPADPSSPVLRIRGFAMMGGVDVRIRLPGESEREARARRKAERRARRLPPLSARP